MWFWRNQRRAHNTQIARKASNRRQNLQKHITKSASLLTKVVVLCHPMHWFLFWWPHSQLPCCCCSICLRGLASLFLYQNFNIQRQSLMHILSRCSIIHTCCLLLSYMIPALQTHCAFPHLFRPSNHLQFNNSFWRFCFCRCFIDTTPVGVGGVMCFCFHLIIIPGCCHWRRHFVLHPCSSIFFINGNCILPGCTQAFLDCCGWLGGAAKEVVGLTDCSSKLRSILQVLPQIVILFKWVNTTADSNRFPKQQSVPVFD